MDSFSLFSKNITAKCGHTTKKIGRVTAFGQSIIMRLPIKNGKTDFCHACLSKMATQCTWCSHTIFIGDIVTIAPPHKKFGAPEKPVLYKNNPRQLIGCGRKHCTNITINFTGIWSPPGVIIQKKPVYYAIMKRKKVFITQ